MSKRLTEKQKEEIVENFKSGRDINSLAQENNCTNLTEFMKLFDVPVDSDNKPTGNAAIYDFPDEV